MNFQSAIRAVGSHPSQEGAPGISVNSSPLMTVKAAGGTQLPEFSLAGQTFWGNVWSLRPGFRGTMECKQTTRHA